MSKIDPRIVKTKRQIDRALLENLRQFPFSKITVEMLCKTAMVNRSTFYKYYVDKFDLLESYLSRVLEAFREQAAVDFVLATPSNVGGEQYMQLFRSFAQYLYENREVYQVLWSVSLGRNIYEEMIRVIQEKILNLLQESGTPARESIYCELYAYMFASNNMSLTRWWFAHESQVTLEDVMRLMTRNMEEGLFRTFKEHLGLPKG